VSLRSVLQSLLGVSQTVVEGVDFDSRSGGLVVRVRPTKRASSRCPACGAKSPRYDAGRGRRRWRGLDFGSTMVVLEADAPRIECRAHGVVVAGVPWARPGSWFTRDFEQQVAWMALHACRSVVAEVMRIDWKTVGAVIARVQRDEAARGPSPLTGLVNIGIDETSYTKGHNYMTVVVDHDRNTVVWAAKGHGAHVLEGFFALLDDAQKASIRCVTADGARWIAEGVQRHCPHAVRALDPFHTVSWASDALDEVRRQAWRDARRQPAPRRGRGRPVRGSTAPADPAKDLRGARYALLKNPESLTGAQKARLDLIVATNPVLHRAYQLKEKLRLLLKLPHDEAETELNTWLGWAQRCRIPVFVELGRKIKRHRQAILDTIRLGLTNARIEATNNKIKLTIRMGYGFRNIDNLIALVMLKCGGLHLTLPGRPTHTSS